MYERKYANFRPRPINSHRDAPGLIPTLKVGDYVQLLTNAATSTFAKSFQQIYTAEIFQVAAVVDDTPSYYKLVDLAGEDITGRRPEQELKPVAKPDIFKVAKIVAETPQICLGGLPRQI